MSHKIAFYVVTSKLFFFEQIGTRDAQCYKEKSDRYFQSNFLSKKGKYFFPLRLKFKLSLAGGIHETKICMISQMECEMKKSWDFDKKTGMDFRR